MNHDYLKCHDEPEEPSSPEVPDDPDEPSSPEVPLEPDDPDEPEVPDEPDVHLKYHYYH